MYAMLCPQTCSKAISVVRNSLRIHPCWLRILFYTFSDLLNGLVPIIILGDVSVISM